MKLYQLQAVGLENLICPPRTRFWSERENLGMPAYDLTAVYGNGWAEVSAIYGNGNE
jgi:hypothetical protein